MTNAMKDLLHIMDDIKETQPLWNCPVYAYLQDKFESNPLTNEDADAKASREAADTEAETVIEAAHTKAASIIAIAHAEAKAIKDAKENEQKDLPKRQKGKNR